MPAGVELWRADGNFVSESFGWRIAGGGDVDGDGTPDAATALQANGHALSGVDGARLLSYHAGFWLDSVWDIALVPDRNGDGLDELALSGSTYVANKVETIAPVPIDCDGSGELDFIELAQAMAPDCNATYVPDACDIASGASLDLNSDGIPDECQVTFFGSPGTISVATGGEYSMRIYDKPLAAGKAYFIAGSLSGYLPGMTIAGTFVPLNPDAWFVYTINHASQGPLVSTAGTLGSFGETTAPKLVVPAGLDPSWIGVTFHHAYALIDGATVEKVSNAIALTLVP